MDLQVRCSDGLSGERSVPGDKSISHRALLIGALAEGVSSVEGLSVAADVLSTRECLKALGIQIESKNSETLIYGKGPRGFKKSNLPLNAGNSGTTMRLLSGILAGQRFDAVIVGDPSLSKRPMKRIIEPLQLMGANISGTPEFTAPLRISSTYNLQSIQYDLTVPSAQVKSAILLAGLYTEGTTRITEHTPTRDHTERMMGLQIQEQGRNRIVEIKGGQRILPKHFVVPGDISAATFLIAAGAIVPHSEITIRNVGLNPTRSAVLDVFRKMNVNFKIENRNTAGEEDSGDIVVTTSDLYGDITIEGEDVAKLIDELPMLAAVTLFSQGKFTLKDAVELRHKESDRISAMVSNLRLLGVGVEESPDGFSIRSKEKMAGNALESYDDHRIAMSFGVVGLRLPGTTIRNAECVSISFPNFWDAIGA